MLTIFDPVSCNALPNFNECTRFKDPPESPNVYDVAKADMDKAKRDKEKRQNVFTGGSLTKI
jgi:hypothetical protein